jgi:murein DD-endopeptidase MepM/ murein hydrolase activator NlpD
MMTDRTTLGSLGNEPPILADGRRAPDRREVSLRWLSGTFLTGVTSSMLMGVALFAAFDGHQQLAIPAEAYATADSGNPGAGDAAVTRGGRLIATQIAAKPADRSILEVSTVVRDGDKDVVRRQPFAHVKMQLAANHMTSETYPTFDPLTIFATDESLPAAVNHTGAIYGSDVESEVSLKTVPFPPKGTQFTLAAAMSLEEVEENVRSSGSILTDANSQLSSLYYVDPRRFAADDGDVDLTAGLAARIVEENMSVSAPEQVTPNTPEYADDIIPIRQTTAIDAALSAAGYTSADAGQIAASIEPLLGAPVVNSGDVLRIGILQTGERAKIIRASLYHGVKHALTIALDDSGHFIAGSEPPPLDAVATAFDNDTAPVAAGRDLPRVYDGIYRAGLSYGMTREMIAQIIKLLASNVDFQAQLKPTDMLEAFFSVANNQGQATPDSELLYVNARFGDTLTRFYRFEDPDDQTIDYFNEDGKSIRQFLLRNPVPTGVFTSGFGMRRHPILGFARMHTGVDWAGPRGTPIIAAGNGVVEKAGWDSGGFGNQTMIRHANGYVSSYNHQSAIAKGVVPGAKVVQGQVIGFIGSTGMATGAHLHYELIVNGTKVDPLRIRLPGGKSLDGDALAKFEDERKRIDTLLSDEKAKQVASRE